MVHTGKDIELDQDIAEFIVKLAESFEFYLPDEKISSVWQETELISTKYPDFEAVYFERELEHGWLYLSNEFEFFPIFMLYQMIQMGKPTIMFQGIFEGSDIINLEAGEEVFVIGFADPGTEDKLNKALPPVDDREELSFDLMRAMAMLYLDEIM